MEHCECGRGRFAEDDPIGSNRKVTASFTPTMIGLYYLVVKIKGEMQGSPFQIDVVASPPIETVLVLVMAS